MLWDVGFSAVHLDGKSRERRGLSLMGCFGPVKCFGEEVNNGERTDKYNW
jgi:hypothetical protein